MTEEEKAIEYLTKYINWETYGERSLEKDIKTTLDLVKKQNKKIHFLDNKLKFIIIKIVDKAKIYEYHSKITAGTNFETNIAFATLQVLLEEINKEI